MSGYWGTLPAVFFHQSTSAWGHKYFSWEQPGRNFESRLAVPTLCKGMRGAAGEVGDGKSKAGLATGRKKRRVIAV
jgi:hypothetical protein